MLLFFSAETKISFKSGKKGGKTRISIILTINPYLSQVEMQKCNRIIFFNEKKKEILSITILVH